MGSVHKGKAAEREFAAVLRERLKLNARRSQQYCGIAGDGDVVCELPIFFEVKRRESLNIYKAMEKASSECGEKVPVIAHRKNRTDWHLTIRASDLESFCSLIYGRVR